MVSKKHLHVLEASLAELYTGFFSGEGSSVSVGISFGAMRREVQGKRKETPLAAPPGILPTKMAVDVSPN